MKTCKYSKRLQIYLDGWMENVEAARFERHLKKCASCQAELIELEDVSSSALEIVDEAPENSYWDSFYARTLNRILSRNVTPYEQSEEPHKRLRLKIGSYSLAIVSLAALILITVNFLPDVLKLMAEKNLENQRVTGKEEPAALVESPKIPDLAESKEPVLQASVSETAEPEQVDIMSANTDPVLSETNDGVVPEQPAVSSDEVLSYFRSDLLSQNPGLTLNDLPDYSGQSTSEQYNNINEDYRLSSSMISAGILSEAGDGYNSGRSLDGYSGFYLDSRGSNDFLNGVSGDWGYLSMPPDSTEAEEFRRYLIELELIQTK